MFLFRPLTIAALVLGGWLGMKLERHFAEGRCHDAGGEMSLDGVCLGAESP